ncbi:MAG: UDP-N-acetylglucosamine 2-epimerase (hydrolyzing) [Candidatus Saganbacteria bacterium]|nr:UDP-N-acetylglucosamine 2-epimerase (hydrolyzing) [Candidatus Saganbacteria bacterium]
MSKKIRKICIVTGSRADYGLLYWLMKEIKSDKDLLLQIVAAGMHLSSRFGLTYKQILRDEFKIDAKVDLLKNSDTDQAIALSIGRGVIGFARVFSKLSSDVVVLLGDRFETLAAATSAMILGIPIAHIHGGEVTEGAYDDSIRHAITKMAHLHFVSHNIYAMRVVQMGENPKRVFNYGAPGLDSIRQVTLLTRKELEKELNFVLGSDVVLVTYHPTTLEKGAAKNQIKNILNALAQTDLRIVFTVPNADSENQVIYDEIMEFVRNNPEKAIIFKSLGQLKYLSLLKCVGLMLGNSSSGVIEAPSFKLPVVNIGTRQTGRLKANNVIDTDCKTASIIMAIKKAKSTSFGESMVSLKNPFGDGRSSKKIKNKLKNFRFSGLAKGFYDIK